jgi:magnesium chelatase subunit D
MNWSQIVGLDSAKQALLLLAVEPRLGGVAMAAGVGSGKSTLARAFAALLPYGTPFVELPLNITEDRLIGGLDLEATLATGTQVVEKGLLARANGGVLYVDALNLLDDGVATQVMDAMGRGAVRVEREGLSATHAAQFVLIGTYDSSDGDVRGGLLDRVGLIVPFAPNGDAMARAEVVRRNKEIRDWRLEIGTAQSPISNLQSQSDEVEMLRGMIGFAREQLAQVKMSDAQLEGIAQAALSLGVEGNRVDVFAARAAVAAAALGGRDEVDDEDLQIAARLVLMPRATRLPEQETAESQEPRAESQEPRAESQEPRAESQEPRAESQEQRGKSQDENKDESQANQQEEPQIEELMLSAAEAALPSDVMSLPFVARRGKSGSRGVQLNNRRGKFVRAVPGELRGHKLALLPTLLAAAPWQKLRRLEIGEWRLKTRPISNLQSLISVRVSDIRIKKFRDKAGTLFIFVVDASGSMALNRMRQAKGAVAKLLQNAYVHRDQVALVAFRGKAAQVLLPPSTSVERAKRELDVLPTGGGTPLASALMLAWDTVQQARRKQIPNATLVVMTDGRGNVALQGMRDEGLGMREENSSLIPHPSSLKSQIEDELKSLSALIAADGVRAVVIDTQANYLSRGEAPKLAQWLGGRYVYLPNAQAGQIVEWLSG